MKKLIALLLCLVMVLGLAACGGDTNPTDGPTDKPDTPTSSDNPTDGPTEPEPTEYVAPELQGEAGKYTYHTATTGLPSNWNPHDYEDNNSSTIMSYLVDSLYTMAFNDELHPMDDPSRTPYDGYVWLPSMASGMPVDVTAEVAAEHPDWIPEGATSGYAWAFPLRDNLYFDTGYHITADTFVEGAKRILNGELLNYRSTDVYAGTYGIVGAEDYFNGGRYSYDFMISEAMEDDEYVDPSTFTTSADGTLQLDGKDIVMNVKNNGNWGGGAPWSDNIPAEHQLIAPMHAAADKDGYVKLTPEMLTNLQTIIAMLHGYATVEDYAAAEGDYAYMEFEEACWYGYDHPAVDWDSTVGIYAKDEYTLVEVYKASCADFTLFYNAIQDSLLLVEPDVYDKLLSQQADGTWSSTYMTSVETSPSYGPYSLTDFQTDKMAHFSKNDSWYGYTDETTYVYKDPTDGETYHMYQTTDIDIQVISEAATRLNMFLTGQLISYGLQAADMAQYRNSDRVYVTPAPDIFFFLLTGNKDGLDAREAAGDFDTATQDIQTILVPSFRKAMAVAFDRQSFCDEVSPSTTPGLGIFGATIIYDPATAGYYRDTPQAKQALCDFYGVDASKFASLDDAVDSITGYDPVQAKELLKAAFQESLDAGYITDADNDGKCDQDITLLYALSAESDGMTLRINWIDNALTEVAKDTPFEGKLHCGKTAPLGSGSEFADALKSGSADVCLAGWTGSAMDPYNLLQAYTWDSYSYAAAWYHPQTDMLTLTLNGEEITMSVYNWAEAVTGTNALDADGNVRNFGTNVADQETRVQILAGVEGKLLQTYTYLPMINDGGLSLLSYQVYYVIEDYNPVMGRGGISYMRYNYDDAEWAEYCNEQNAEHGRLQY